MKPAGPPTSSARARCHGGLTVHETAAVVRVQSWTASPAVRQPALILSRAGEHALCWTAFGVMGAVLDPRQRRDWIRATATVVGAHAASVVLKRVLRRGRPADPRVQVLTATAGRWSFPSSHATSTTAAAVAYSRLLGNRYLWGWIPLMMASRVILGVHFPSDVLAGSVMGGTLARWADPARGVLRS